MENKKILTKVEGLEKSIKKLGREVKKLKNIPPCPKCRSKEVIKRGTRKTTGRGIVQRYACKKCNWKFSKYDLDYRMRNDIRDIRRALYLRKKGYTLSQIAEIIGGVSRQTILRWLKKYYESFPKEKIISRVMKSRWGTTYRRNFTIHI